MKVKILIEDQKNGSVKVTAKPKMSELLQKAKDGVRLTVAEGYAYTALLALLEQSKKDVIEIGVPTLEEPKEPKKKSFFSWN